LLCLLWPIEAAHSIKISFPVIVTDRRRAEDFAALSVPCSILARYANFGVIRAALGAFDAY
jgi:hypothetical protein